MEKYYIIRQPPLAEKYTFLVDQISIKSDYGLATDIQKIDYNRYILGETFNIEVNLSLLMTEEEGSTFVFDLGYFVVILEISKDQQQGQMSFYHALVSINRNELFKLFSQRYSTEIAAKWLEVYDFIHSDLMPDRNNVQIYKPGKYFDP